MVSPFIHPDGRGGDPRADEGDLRQLENALEGSIFSAGSVDDGKSRIELVQRPSFGIHQNGGTGFRAQSHARAGFRRVFRRIQKNPRSLDSDQDGEELDLFWFDRIGDGGCGGQRDPVLGRPAAEYERDASNGLGHP